MTSNVCLILATVLAGILTETGCKDHGIEPPPPPPKNPRDYTWTRDTLAYPGSYQTLMNRIWGSSANDVYIVGHNDQNRGLMWHFDGTSWTDVKLSTTQGGTIAGPIDLSSVYGFESNDVWAVGERIQTNPTPPPNFIDSSLTIHFDGTHWTEVRLLGGRYLMDVWGTSSNDIWTCGWYGTVAHFDGSRWRRESLPLTVPSGGFFYATHVGGANGTVFCMANVNLDSLGQVNSYFFQRSASTWSLVDSFVVGSGPSTQKWGTGGFWVSPGKTVFSFGVGVFQWVNGSWVNVFSTVDPLRGMRGTNDHNIFAVGDFGNVYHFNGSDWYKFTGLEDPTVVFSDVWTDGNEAFIVGWTISAPQKTIILHGK